MRQALMGVEVALALVVLMAAALFVRSFNETRETDPGFRREGVLLAAYDLTGRNVDPSVARDFARRLLERLRALPGVEAAALATSVPLDIHGLPIRSFTLEGRARGDASADQALSNIVTPEYFRVMGIPMRRGAGFADFGDATASAQVVLNEEFVRRFLPGAEPLGRRVENRGRRYAIAGVVRNSLSDSFGEPPAPVMYFSYRDRPAALGQIHVRTPPHSHTRTTRTRSRGRRAISALYRRIHVSKLGPLAHRGERVLSRLRDGVLVITPRHCRCAARARPRASTIRSSRSRSTALSAFNGGITPFADLQPV
jgi:putative ABC transport system permease protein